MKLPEPTIGEVVVVTVILGITGGMFLALLVPACFIAGGCFIVKYIFDIRDDDEKKTQSMG